MIKQLLLIALLAMSTEGQPVRRALLIGIDDYTASTLPALTPVAHRGWPDLQGAANDVRILADMLVLRHGFERKHIVTLTNQQATRAAILSAIEHLARSSRKGDVVFYYFAGHGAQVPNATSDEPDRLDESIVPADSRRGAADIRDKELRPFFNRILDRGARLTLFLDHCHSGGGFRSRPSGARSIAKALPILDRRDYGPPPDARGALVLVSAQDADVADEMRGADGLMHGAFTWAWIRAMRDATAGEPAQETFLRAQARLRYEKPYQAPAILGTADVRLRPFLGIDRRTQRSVIGVESVTADGRIILQGGRAHGLGVDSELAAIDDRRIRVRITQLLGIGRSVARMHPARAAAPNIHSGALLEIVSPGVHPLLSLTSPDVPAYRLAVRDERTKQLIDDATLIGRRIYSIVLRARQTNPAPRYYYVFVVDSAGNSRLVFPATGSVENRFPIRHQAPGDVALGNASAFRISPPYGMDTYFLLSTEEALPDPSILAWDDVRARRALAETHWSIARITFESVAPTRRRTSAVRAAPRHR